MRRVLDFRDHGRDLDGNRYVYAVVSRRAGGLSIGVNLNPDKLCNFACPYCQVDRRAPTSASAVEVEGIVTELTALLGQVASGNLWRRAPFDTVVPALRRVADIAFSGDGEPTLAEAFPEAARRVRDARDAHGLDMPLRLLTNATLLHRPLVRAALVHFDELWCKLDAGTERHFRFVAGTELPFRRVLDNLLSVARERPIVIQSLFFAYQGSGPSEDEVQAYLERLAGIRASGGRIARVQVYTVARPPADPHVEPLAGAALEAIAAGVEAMGLTVDGHGRAHEPFRRTRRTSRDGERLQDRTVHLVDRGPGPPGSHQVQPGRTRLPAGEAHPRHRVAPRPLDQPRPRRGVRRRKAADRLLRAG